jgi:hypothetical protein
MTERRKLNMGIIFSVQDFLSMVPKPIRWLTHYEARCWDLYWANTWAETKYERGKRLSVCYCDRKGFRTGFPFTWSFPEIFRGDFYWKHFDTNKTISVWEQFSKIDIKRRKYSVDPWGEDEVAGPSPIEQMLGLPQEEKNKYIQGLLDKGMKIAEVSKIQRKLQKL